jgi:endonuclease/exonuclease/phosphatase family metal-dependent hydrolase
MSRRESVLRTRPAARRAALAVIAALAATLAIGPATASAKQNRELTVMTYNLYLGSSLDPALDPDVDTLPEFVGAVAQIYGTAQFTDFPARAEAIADLIEAKDPDLIGLQEVTNWITTGTAPSYDFLTILQSALDARGLDYEVAAVSNNANIGPAPLISPSSGCLTALPVPDCTVQLKDRDVILVNEDTPGLTWSNAKSDLYDAQQVINSPAGPLSFDRGWASIDARLQGKPFKFVNTHLEVEGSPLVQEAQAAEFLSGPARGGNVIATGDFNSAADGSTTTSYAQLTAPGRFRDAWDESTLGTGNTCCQNSTLTDFPPSLTSRIDLILSRAAARATGAAEVIGGTPFQLAPPLYPSDHAGVVANIRLGG